MPQCPPFDAMQWQLSSLESRSSGVRNGSPAGLRGPDCVALNLPFASADPTTDARVRRDAANGSPCPVCRLLGRSAHVFDPRMYEVVKVFAGPSKPTC